jgi:hypothetical protein
MAEVDGEEKEEEGNARDSENLLNNEPTQQYLTPLEQASSIPEEESGFQPVANKAKSHTHQVSTQQATIRYSSQFAKGLGKLFLSFFKISIRIFFLIPI